MTRYKLRATSLTSRSVLANEEYVVFGRKYSQGEGQWTLQEDPTLSHELNTSTSVRGMRTPSREKT